MTVRFVKLNSEAKRERFQNLQAKRVVRTRRFWKLHIPDNISTVAELAENFSKGMRHELVPISTVEAIWRLDSAPENAL